METMGGLHNKQVGAGGCMDVKGKGGWEGGRAKNKMTCCLCTKSIQGMSG